MLNDISDLKPICSGAASVYDVTADIHPEDMIFRFLVNNPCFPTKTPAVEYYFRDGRKSAETLSTLLGEMGFHDDPLSLLEFASGYGCVSRHLKNLEKRFDLTSCDIHPAATDFLKNNLGVGKTILSAHDPVKFSTVEKYNVVFALSFFSHMPMRTWGRWLLALFDCVAPKGVLIFTTQGRDSAQHLGNPAIPQDGFWFSPTSEQEDLDTAEYGQTICTPEFVCNEVHKQLSTSISQFRGAYWWGHQDLYVIAKR